MHRQNSSSGPVLRLARRDALRHPLRSFLIALLIAMPVAAAAAVDIYARTTSRPGGEGGHFGSGPFALPDPRAWRSLDQSDLLLVGILAGLALIEITLLAGTAFAIGARRRTRELGVLAAQGADDRVLRRVVRAQGLLLGVLGAGAGIAIGAAVMVATRHRWHSGPVTFGAYELAAAFAVGVVGAVGAAGLSTRGAARRSPAVARGDGYAARPRGAGPGLAALATGALLAVVGSQNLQAGLERELRTSRYDDVLVGPFVTDYGGQGLVAVLVGSFIVFGGLFLLAPSLLHALGRRADGLPLSIRLATRDLARQRHRTAPAVCAIAVATAGAVALSIFVASERHSADLRTEVALPDRTVVVTGRGAASVLRPHEAAAVAAVAAVLPAARTAPLDAVDLPTLGAALEPTDSIDRTIYDGPDYCSYRPAPCDPLTPPPGLGDPALLAVISDGPAATAAMTAALDAEKVVVFDPKLINGAGKVTIFTNLTEDRKPRFARLPAALFHRIGKYQRLPDAYIGAATARARGWTTAHAGTVVTHGPAEPARVRAALAAARAAKGLGDASFADDPTGPADLDRDRQLKRRMALAGAVVVALLGVGIPIGLSDVEARGDVATLAAVGAEPRRRRRVAAVQALLLAGLGTALGAVLGLAIARAARPATGSVSTVVPWGDLGVFALGVLAVGLAVGLAGAARRPGKPRQGD